MHTHSLHLWQHAHTFGQDRMAYGERRTEIVIAITGLVMIVEVVAGIAFGSLALLADGLHMGSHTAALGLTVLAYVYARKFSGDRRFSFGTGKVNALAGFSSAILLAGFALSMVWESIHRLSNPVEIIYDQAIAVSVFGLMVNALSAYFLAQHHDETGHPHDETAHQPHGHSHTHGQPDHNLRSAYLHVLADALTSLLAIFALSAGKWFGLWWMDPLMGIVGAILITRWSWGLLRDTSAVLLDRQAPLELEQSVRAAIEGEDGNRIADLHLWSIGPEIYAAAMSIVTERPNSPPHYKSLLPATVKLAHVTIEVHPCNQDPVSLGHLPAAIAGMPSPNSA